ncbi:RNA polymerase sigma factor [Almyronema epifaneia]|uniref:RNA polymerase sigma factor n=1 Tax=Almyronema epifaneia S1 TaxID=2991925 RepID=A0ABW6IB69_9CYAN
MDLVCQQLKRLNEVMNAALSAREEGSSKRLVFFVRRSLQQFNLYGEWCESEILIDAYLRTRQKIEHGEVIDNFPGYLSSVSFNIIREHHRSRQRKFAACQKMQKSEANVLNTPESPYLDEKTSDFSNLLWESFESLRPKDQEILILRIVKGYSWSEIGDFMVATDKELRNDLALRSRLRKQGERALERLRKAFSSVT